MGVLVMTNDEYMIAYRRTYEVLNPGGPEVCERLIPGMLALGFVVLGYLAETENASAARVRALSAAALKRTLVCESPKFSTLRDDLAVLCWHELACRGEAYQPRGVVDVAHAWAWIMGDVA